MFNTINWEENVSERYYFNAVITMIKLSLTVKHISLQRKSFLNCFFIENVFAKYFTKFYNLFIEYFVLHIMIISQNDALYIQDKSNVLVLHNFMKCFSGPRVN